jgi:hypothetical protein
MTYLRTITIEELVRRNYLLGHSSLGQTARYLHVPKRHLSAAVTPLDALTSANNKTDPNA